MTFGVSIVILTFNGLPYTQQCIEAIRKHTTDYQIVVVDNHSTDGSLEWLKEQDDVALYPQVRNEGFATGCNIGVGYARYGSVCLLNNDCIPQEGWLDALRGSFTKGVGIVGARLVLPNGKLQHAGVYWQKREKDWLPYHRYMHLPARIDEASQTMEVPAVTGACMLTNRTVWNRVGGMDDGYMQANFEDIDFCMKVRETGQRIIYEPKAVLMHYHSMTIKECQKDPDQNPARYYQANFQRLMAKWQTKLDGGMNAV